MSEALTIRERVERRIVGIVEDVTDVTRVHRSNYAGEDTVEHRHAYVWPNDESSEPATLGSTSNAQDEELLPVNVAVAIAMSTRDIEHESPASIHNRWLGRLRTALTADPFLLDDLNEDEPLANAGQEPRITQASTPPAGPGQTEFIVEVTLEVRFRHYQNDPTAGNAVTAYTE